MLTNSDITKFKAVFATKEDLKRFATKEDLKAFATKEDLKRFATKEDLKAFATKEDLKGVEKKFEDKLNGFKDEILAEIKNLRDDIAIVIGYRDMIEQHDIDIETIKKHLKLPVL